jgi:hypothetical protein
MKWRKTLISGLAGTTLMTLFSYAISETKKRNFKEPDLLGGLLQNKLESKKLALPAGWSTHYTMGILWAFVFEFLFEKARLKRDLKNGIILGGLSGVTGIIAWRMAFKMHPNPPRIDANGFYKQLLIAHIVYSIVLTKSSKHLG